MIPFPVNFLLNFNENHVVNQKEFTINFEKKMDVD